MAFFQKKDPHRARLIKILEKIPSAVAPGGWAKVVSAAVGGLSEVGFSKKGPYLLIVSSQGRGLFDCRSGE